MQYVDKHISIKNNKLLYYYLASPESKTDNIVILIHGLISSPTEALYFNSFKQFCSKGFIVALPCLYDWRKNARKLDETCINTHIEDISELIRYFQGKFKNIYLAGHSIGGVISMLLAIKNSSNDKIKAISLWDPTTLYYLERIKNKMTLNESSGLFAYTGSGISVQFTPKYVNSIEQAKKELEENITKISIPAQIIAAGDGVLTKGCKEYLDMLTTTTKELEVIPEATHFFNEQWKANQVYLESSSFLAIYNTRLI